VTVVSGSLEGSNTNMVESLVNMITLARQFDMQMKMLQTADDNAKQASSVLSVTG
jgi:flagellar basal-body rod protein FlgF